MGISLAGVFRIEGMSVTVDDLPIPRLAEIASRCSGVLRALHLPPILPCLLVH